MIDVVEYLDEKGRSPYEKGFNNLSPQAAAKVAKAMINRGFLAKFQNLYIASLLSKITPGTGTFPQKS